MRNGSRPAPGNRRHGIVLPLFPRRRTPPPPPRDPRACLKCGSLFVVWEPAFVHCRYCGAMNRIPESSLVAQEEFELRSGLRLAG